MPQELHDAVERLRREVSSGSRSFELVTLRLTALKLNSSQFAAAETSRGELTSSDKTGKIRFTFSSCFLFITCRIRRDLHCTQNTHPKLRGASGSI